MHAARPRRPVGLVQTLREETVTALKRDITLEESRRRLYVTRSRLLQRNIRNIVAFPAHRNVRSLDGPIGPVTRTRKIRPLRQIRHVLNNPLPLTTT
ncbi:hypothetical protein AB0D74_47640, partial [Streptomyces sp. NPDC048278]|uniref:hypothetical protein n=1 Tax=Streptomyces sp. NPDC048278 TaxID=3155809 RepID=UPI003432AD4C